MKYGSSQKKMTYEMKSVGDAWMDHVQKHHNTDAVTPVYLAYKEPAKNSNKENMNEKKSKPDLYHEAIRSKDDNEKNNSKQPDKNIDLGKGK